MGASPAAAELVCPKCKSPMVRRSRHLSAWSRLVCRLKGQRPYRCMNCDTRFLVYVQNQDVEEPDVAH